MVKTLRSIDANFDKIISRLHKLQLLGSEPVNTDSINKALDGVDLTKPVESIEESFDEYVEDSAFIEEEATARTQTTQCIQPAEVSPFSLPRLWI